MRRVPLSNGDFITVRSTAPKTVDPRMIALVARTREDMRERGIDRLLPRR